MRQTDAAQQSSSSLFRLLLSCLSADWIVTLFDLYRSLHRIVSRERHEGMYESLDYDSVLTLVDATGETAVFKKRQKIKFLQDDVIAFQDHVWGEGQILADYKCSPGVMVDRYQDGDRWHVLISLRERKNSGDIVDFHIQRTAKHSFTKDEEWTQTNIRYRTRQLSLSVIFPKERRCQRAVLIERNRNRTTVLDQKYFADLPDGRQKLTWKTSKPRRFEVYTIKWKW